MLDKFKNDFKYNFKWDENFNISLCVFGACNLLGPFHKLSNSILTRYFHIYLCAREISACIGPSASYLVNLVACTYNWVVKGLANSFEISIIYPLSPGGSKFGNLIALTLFPLLFLGEKGINFFWGTIFLKEQVF